MSKIGKITNIITNLHGWVSMIMETIRLLITENFLWVVRKSQLWFHLDISNESSLRHSFCYSGCQRLFFFSSVSYLPPRRKRSPLKSVADFCLGFTMNSGHKFEALLQWTDQLPYRIHFAKMSEFKKKSARRFSQKKILTRSIYFHWASPSKLWNHVNSWVC